MSTITIHHPVGQVAAVLTGFEFLLTAISAIALRASIRGIWLLSLHRSRRIALSAASRARRGTLADLISFIMGVWLALSVALVESNLSSGVRISNTTPKPGPHCLAMNSTALPNTLVGSITPTLRAGVEPWALAVAMQSGCDALASVGTEVGTHIESGQKVDMAAPLCTEAVALSRRSGRPPATPPEDDDDDGGGALPLLPPPPSMGDDGESPQSSSRQSENRPPTAQGRGDLRPHRQQLSSLQRQSTDLDDGISIHMNAIKVSPRIMSVKPGLSPYVEMWPLDARHIPARGMHPNLEPIDEDSDPESRPSTWEVAGVCTRMGISSMRLVLGSGSWTGLFSDQTRTEFAVHELLCAAHAATHPKATGDGIVALDEVVGIEAALRCRHGDRHQDFEPTCLHQLAINASDDAAMASNKNTTLLYSTNVNRMWTFILGLKASSPSYACVNATVRVSYVIVTADFIMKFKVRAAEAAERLGDPPFPQFPTLIPVHYSVISGHCERVVHVLGRAALSYAADALWRNTTLSSLSLVETLHTLLIATASIQLPLTDLDVTSGTDLDEQWCLTRAAIDVTEIERDWRFWLLVTAVVVSFVLAVVAVGFRASFRGGAWGVGSAHWTLEQVEKGKAQAYGQFQQPQQQSGEEGSVHLEVVVKGNDASAGGGGAGMTKRKTMSATAKGQGAGSSGGASPEGSMRWWDVQELTRSLSNSGTPLVYELHTTATTPAAQQQQHQQQGRSGGDGGGKLRTSGDVIDEQSSDDS